LAALQLVGLPTAGLVPKSVDTMLATPIDLVVTVCDNAQESCPIFPRPVPRLHQPFHDPHGESLARFEQVRDEIRTRLVPAVRAALGLTA
jgi:arsenate reductase